MIEYDKLFIGGRWVEPSSSAVFELHSPHDGRLVGRTPEAVEADVDAAVAVARDAFDHGPWPRTTPEERQAVITRFEELHSKRVDELALLVTAENGTPLWFNRSVLEMVREQGAAYLRAAAAHPWERRTTTTSGQTAVVRSEPVGVVAAVIPWNAPQQSALVKVIPALLAGCTVLLKVTPDTALDGIALGEIFQEAGLPEGVLSIIPAGREVSQYLVTRPGVDKIAFTGSTRAGRAIASLAGEQLKRVSLELGGKSAAIILEDADLAGTVEGLRWASLLVSGEACMASTRILAPRSRYEEVVTAIAEMADSLVVGDPADDNTYIGPIVNASQYERVTSYIKLGQEEGARLVTGGADKPAGDQYANGFYVRPTIFADVDNSMRIAREEIFGPVLVIIPYDDEAEAVAIANDSDYGLSGSVWTADPERGLEIARQVRTGVVFVNGAQPDFDSPYGGFKCSGIGREFGASGLGLFVEYQTVTL